MKSKFVFLLLFSVAIQLNGWTFRTLCQYTVAIYLKKDFFYKTGFSESILCEIAKNPGGDIRGVAENRDEIIKGSIVVSRIKQAFFFVGLVFNFILVVIFFYLSRFFSLTNKE